MTPWTAAHQTSLFITISEADSCPLSRCHLSHLLLPPSLPALNVSHHQGLFQWLETSHQVDKMFKLQLQHQSFQWIPRISSKVLKRKRGELNQAGESFVLLVGALRVPTWEGRRAEEKLKIKMHALKQWHLAKWLDSWHYTSSYAISKRFLWAPVLLRKARLEVGIRTFYTKTWSCFNRTFRKELFSSFIYLLFVKKKKKKKTCFYPKEYNLKSNTTAIFIIIAHMEKP